MQWINKFFLIFWNISTEMAPWLLLGLLFAGILHVFLPKKYIYNQLGGKSFKSICKAIILGVPLPLCSCGVIPTAIHLNKNGASKSTINAFLISTPQTGVDSILATYALLGFPFALLRPIIAILSGLFGGLFTSLFENENTIIKHKAIKEEEFRYKNKMDKWKEVFRYGFSDMLKDIAKWLVIGILLASIFTLLIPEELFNKHITNFYAQMGLIFLISLPLYVCATGSIPIALVLIAKGVDPSLIVLFLMIGPATNIASVVLIINSIGKKTFYYYLISLLITGVFFTILIHYSIPKEWFINAIPIRLNQESISHNSLINIISAIVLYFLIASLYFKKNKKIKNKDLELTVGGMTCSHCKKNVEENIGKIKGVNEATVQLNKNKLYIKGNPDLDKIKNKIIELGYKIID